MVKKLINEKGDNMLLTFSLISFQGFLEKTRSREIAKALPISLLEYSFYLFLS